MDEFRSAVIERLTDVDIKAGVAEAFANIAKQVVTRLSKDGGPAPARAGGGGAGGGGVKVEAKPAEKKAGGGWC